MSTIYKHVIVLLISLTILCSGMTMAIAEVRHETFKKGSAHNMQGEGSNPAYPKKALSSNVPRMKEGANSENEAVNRNPGNEEVKAEARRIPDDGKSK
jgi:CBS domain containing-hemolysin-like protein